MMGMIFTLKPRRGAGKWSPHCGHRAQAWSGQFILYAANECFPGDIHV